MVARTDHVASHVAEIMKQRQIETIDGVLDVLPVISTITNIALLGMKIVYLPWTSTRNHFVTHLKEKSALVCLWSTIPIIANIVNLILFIKRASQSSPEEEIKALLQQLDNVDRDQLLGSIREGIAQEIEGQEQRNSVQEEAGEQLLGEERGAEELQEEAPPQENPPPQDELDVPGNIENTESSTASIVARFPLEGVNDLLDNPQREDHTDIAVDPQEGKPAVIERVDEGEEAIGGISQQVREAIQKLIQRRTEKTRNYQNLDELKLQKYSAFFLSMLHFLQKGIENDQELNQVVYDALDEQSSFGKMMKSMFMEGSLNGKEINDRALFQDVFLLNLRNSIGEYASLSEQQQQIIDCIVQGLFEGDRSAYCNQLGDYLLKNRLVQTSNLSLRTLRAAIEGDCKAIESGDSFWTRAWHSLCGKRDAIASALPGGQYVLKYDPTIMNIPYVRGVETWHAGEENREILFLRHGNPIIEDNSTHRITPEFSHYLKITRKSERNYLYVNLQREGQSDRESERVAVLRKGVEADGVNHHFFSLPMGGRIFKEFASNCTRELFQRSCLDLLFGSVGSLESYHIYLPKGMRQGENWTQFQHYVQTMIPSILDLYFPNVTKIQAEDRNAFLMILFGYLMDYMKSLLEIQVMVASCKDNIDRGNTITTILELLHSLRLGQTNDPAFLRHLRMNLSLPPYWYKKRSINENVHKLYSVIDRLATLTPEQIEAIQRFGAGFGEDRIKLVNHQYATLGDQRED
ncbi:MAG: hypothetical protein JW769_03660 [Parachlamydiales bacterium]|nr:hypothetical protein [Parachlamydiales bacterium]